MKRAWAQHRILGLCLMAACGGSDNLSKGPPIAGGDGGPSGRMILDAAGDGGDPSKDANVPLPDGVTVDIKFSNVGADKVVSASDTSFKPAITVEVNATGKTLLPSVRSAFLEVWVKGTAAPAVRVSLEALARPAGQVDAAAGGVYAFGNILVSLASLKSGVVELRAVVETTNASTVEKSINIQVDAGPLISFQKPGESEPFKTSARIEARISDALFMPIKDVIFELGSTVLTVESPEPGLYVSTVDFRSFTPPLTGEQLVTVRARNGNGTQAVATRKFYADNVGPTFEALMPAQGQLIGGIIEVSAVVKDPSGVEPTSVVAVIGNNSDDTFEVRLDPASATNPEQKYSRLFDTKVLPRNAIFPTVSFRASDKLGNESTAGFLVSYDNTPPIVELDPPSDFRSEVNLTGFLRCSWPFDPVGPDAVDDGQMVRQAFDVRARAEDQGNRVVSGNIDFIPIAGVKKVELLVLDDTKRALVVDTDGDDKCDAMNPLLVPTTRPTAANDILLVGLAPLLPQGTPDNFPEWPDPYPACLTGGMSEPPKPLCDSPLPTLNAAKARYDVRSSPAMPHGHFMSFFLPYTQSKLPAIWAPGPISAGVECAGRQVEAVGSNIKDGWACLAALAEDNVGKKQVSKPIRVCIDHDGDGQECPHRRIVSISSDTPIQVHTVGNHGLASGDEVFIQGELCQTQANGKHKVTVWDATTFSLDTVAGRPDYVGKVPYCERSTQPAWAVPTKELPNCTGKQTKLLPTPVVDDAAACEPWRSFQSNEFRFFQ